MKDRAAYFLIKDAEEKGYIFLNVKAQEFYYIIIWYMYGVYILAFEMVIISMMSCSHL